MSPRINARVVSPPQLVRGLAGPGLQRACIIFTRSSLLPESLEVDQRPDFFVVVFLITLIEDSSHANGSEAARLHQRGGGEGGHSLRGRSGRFNKKKLL